jgi:hypothetical protein
MDSSHKRKRNIVKNININDEKNIFMNIAASYDK